MESRPSDLTGKVILVTGGAKRIGRGIALALAERGARVLIHYGASAEDARKAGFDVAVIEATEVTPDGRRILPAFLVESRP